MTYEDYVNAINKSYKAIKTIDPATPRYEELATLAVSKDGMMIRYVPNPSKKLCKLAIKQLSERKREPYEDYYRPKYSHVLRYIKNPDIDLIKLGLCESPIMINYVVENSVPVDMTKTELIKKLIYHQPNLLEHLDAKHHTPEIIDYILERADYSYDSTWLKSTRQPLAFYWTVLMRDVNTIDFIPNRTPEMVIYALMEDPSLMNFLDNEPPERFLLYAQAWHFFTSSNDIETCLIEKVTIYPTDVRLIPDRYLTLNVFKTAVTAKKACTRWVPHKSPDYLEIAKYAIEADPVSLKYLRRHVEELALLAVSLDGITIKYVTKITKAISEAAVSNNPQALKWVPRRYQSDEMLQSCFDRDPGSIIYSKRFNLDRLKQVLETDETIHLKIISQPRLVKKIGKHDPELAKLFIKTERDWIMAFILGTHISSIPDEHRQVCKRIPQDLASRLACLYFLPYVPKHCFICCELGNMDYKLEPCHHSMCVTCMLRICDKGCPFCRQSCIGISLFSKSEY